MDADKLQPGDVVRLKSGGPAMTVKALHGNGVAECAHFAGPEFHEVFVPAACLSRAEEPAPSAADPAAGA